MAAQQRGQVFRMLVKNIHPANAVSLRKTFQDIVCEEPKRIQYYSPGRDQLLLAIYEFQEKRSVEALLILDKQIIGKSDVAVEIGLLPENADLDSLIPPKFTLLQTWVPPSASSSSTSTQTQSQKASQPQASKTKPPNPTPGTEIYSLDQSYIAPPLIPTAAQKAPSNAASSSSTSSSKTSTSHRYNTRSATAAATGAAPPKAKTGSIGRSGTYSSVPVTRTQQRAADAAARKESERRRIMVQQEMEKIMGKPITPTPIIDLTIEKPTSTSSTSRAPSSVPSAPSTSSSTPTASPMKMSQDTSKELASLRESLVSDLLASSRAAAELDRMLSASEPGEGTPMDQSPEVSRSPKPIPLHLMQSTPTPPIPPTPSIEPATTTSATTEIVEAAAPTTEMFIIEPESKPPVREPTPMVVEENTSTVLPKASPAPDLAPAPAPAPASDPTPGSSSTPAQTQTPLPTSTPTTQSSESTPPTVPAITKGSRVGGTVAAATQHIWSWVNEYLQSDYELTPWASFFFERTKARLLFLKLSEEQTRQMLRPLIAHVDHEFDTRTLGNEKNYHLCWAVFDILLCRLYPTTDDISSSEGDSSPTPPPVDPSAAPVVPPEVSEALSNLSKLSKLVQSILRIHHLEESLNRNTIPPSHTTPNQLPSANVIDTLQLVLGVEENSEENVKRIVEREVLSRYYNAVCEQRELIPISLADFSIVTEQVAAICASNMELIKTRRNLEYQFQFVRNGEVKVNNRSLESIPSITNPEGNDGATTTTPSDSGVEGTEGGPTPINWRPLHRMC